VKDRLTESWVRSQLDPWARRRLKREEVDIRLLDLWQNRPTIALFDIDNGTVRLRQKEVHKSFVMRSRLYLRLFQETLEAHPMPLNALVAVDVNDEAAERKNVPMFSFQKKKGQANILLPDVELIVFDYYETSPIDRRPFSEKKPRAAFAGSTTGGGLITMESVVNRSFPRLRAAAYFRDRKGVDFRLTVLVRCASEEVENALRAEGHGTGRVDWEVGLQNKFIISLDGHGAACSRPAIALNSNSALLKYESDNVLFYSSGLIPWQHYIPIHDDAEVVDIVRAERREPGRYASIAEEGTVFARARLDRKAARLYTAHLLAEYAKLFD
jgi:hypothetical protein